MRKLASIQRIASLEPIPNADFIEFCQVLGWQCAVQKFKDKETKEKLHKVGDLVVYIEYDSVLPDIPLFEFMKDRGMRVKTIKLKGQISQGLVIPLEEVINYITCRKDIELDNNFLTIKSSEIHSNAYLGQCNQLNPSLRLSLDLETGVSQISVEIEEGADLTPFLGIKKYEPYMKNTNGTKLGNVSAKGPFPSFIFKTDEERVQTLPHILEQFKGTECFITEKLDGCLIGSTTLETDFGLKTIEEICNNEINCKIKSFDINKREIVWDKIIGHLVQEKIDNWYEIELEDGSILNITDNHQIWIPEENIYKRVSELTGNELLLVNI